MQVYLIEVVLCGGCFKLKPNSLWSLGDMYIYIYIYTCIYVYMFLFQARLVRVDGSRVAGWGLCCVRVVDSIPSIASIIPMPMMWGSWPGTYM